MVLRTYQNKPPLPGWPVHTFCLVRYDDRVALQSHAANARKQTTDHVGAGLQRDRLVCQDAALEDRVGCQGGRGANLPVDVACFGAADQDDVASRRNVQCGSDLEDEDGIRIALGVQG